MPHTRRKQKPLVKKRKQVQGEDGWTHVTNTAREPPQSFGEIADTHTIYHDYQPEPVSGSTVEALRSQYQGIKAQWKESESCKVLQANLKGQAGPQKSVDKCIIYGTGSLSGLHSGWIDYRSVALSQLAVLETLLESLEDELGARPQGYAQEPAYNDLDVEFLNSLNIKVLRHPEGIQALAQDSLAYLPCSEAGLVLEVLKCNPRIVLGKALANRTWPTKLTMLKHGPDSSVEVESTSTSPEEVHTIVSSYQASRQSLRVPDFDYSYQGIRPFNDEWLYWPDTSDADVIDASA